MRGALSFPFLRLYALALLFFSGNAILNVIIPLKGESLGASNTTIGLIMGAYLFTTMFFRPWAGSIIQRHGSIKVLRTILIINGFALILYTFTGLSGYLVARMLQGVSTAFFSMALQISIIDALPEKDRSQGISLYSLFTYMPGIAGPLLALGLWENGGINAFAIVMVSIAVLTGVFGYGAKIARSPETPESPMNPSVRQGSNMIQSLGELVKNPFLLKCSVMMLSASLVFGAVTAFVPLYSEEVPGGSAGIYLMLQAGTVVLARFALRKKIPSDGKWHTTYMACTMLMLAVASQSVGLADIGGVLFFYLGAVLMGAAQAILYPSLMTYLSFVLPQLNRNVLMGIFIASADLGVSLGGILMGPVADFFSYSFMYTICALLSSAMILVAIDQREMWSRLSKKKIGVSKKERG
ncbi:staphylopine family metallophore export MFS transporter CntE [Paenibacillus sp. PL91]|uniref:staphylopine family metallophore export MFS transporter CntE n=1 Tax=Paenibacillus sp. PL91 TaxID=2729538 RepID=UPI00145DFED0|nr:MFS transporter [Paenibacillus sp. PL91]MBC9204022.1 MFS transporter [Paenibacillus sp. PL91]